MENETDYDLEELAGKIDFSRDDYVPLLEAFVEETLSDIGKIRDGISGRNSDSVSAVLHNIKGAAVNLGLDTIVGYVEEMSRGNKTGDYAVLEEVLNKCADEVDTIKKLL